MRILVIQHVEPMWEASFDKDPEDYIQDILEHIENSNYDRVIITSFDGGYYPELRRVANSIEDWTYGWENPEDYAKWYKDNKINVKDIIPANGHEYTYLYPWIKKLKRHQVVLAGGAQYECLRDLSDAFDHLNIKHTFQKELIYG